MVGQYAMADHFGPSKMTLTDRVRTWRDVGPGVIPLPHPSPRNNLWLKRNPWFEDELVPELRRSVGAALRN